MINKYFSGFLILLLFLCSACSFQDGNPVEATTESVVDPNWEKGYNLTIPEEEIQEATQEIESIMNQYKDIYDLAEKPNTINVVLEEADLQRIQDKIAESGYAVTTSIPYISMKNYEMFDSYLKNCQTGEPDQFVEYIVQQDGTIVREKYIFDGNEMVLLNWYTSWYEEKPQIAFSYMNRIKEWSYTDRGWFAYQVYAPEPPEVSEEVDAAVMVRILPFDEKYMDFSKKYIMPISYHGNNVFRCDWSSKDMSALDYVGMYEFLYLMDKGERFELDDDADGIPAKKFESLIMKYFPTDQKTLRSIKAYKIKEKIYRWNPEGNAEKSYFTTSMPEVTQIEEKKDGVYVMTVEAVCDMQITNDRMFIHEVTVKVKEDGSFQYLRNKIISGTENVPSYIARFVE